MVRAVLVLLLVATLTLSGQTPQSSDYTMTVHVELVTVPVSVVDKKDVPFLGLHLDNFKVFEDKIAQDISLFKQEDVPISAGLVIDSSGSMYRAQDRVNTAVFRFATESNPQDETFVVGFSDSPSLIGDFTSDQEQLKLSLNEITPHGTTALYDAVVFAAQHINAGRHEKKVLLVVSDGEDNASNIRLRDVLERMKESKIIVYTIGLLANDDFLTSESRGKAKSALKALADVTGGQAYFPRSVKDVDDICMRVAHELRNQYTIGYRPTNTLLDGSWRNIKVQLAVPKGTPSLRLRTKRGYYAPTERTMHHQP